MAPLTEADLRARLLTDEHELLVLDFDETLWLRNSTETYLSELRPRWLATILLSALDALKPWNFFPGTEKRFAYRDWLRVLVTTILMPWSLPLWKFRSPRLGVKWKNAALLAILGQARAKQTVVVTFGFCSIVRPLLGEVLGSRTTLFGCSLLGAPAFRRSGKLVALKRCLGTGFQISRATVITDSLDDCDLLEASGLPLWVRWSTASFIPALAGRHLPFAYTQKAKRPGSNTMLFSVLLEDVLVLAFTFLWSSGNRLTLALALLLLHLSFWCVYEIGYYENDFVASRRERSPQLRPEAIDFVDSFSATAAWCYALALGAAGMSLVYVCDAQRTWFHGSREVLALGLAWFAYLAVSRGLFKVFNSISEYARGHLYLLLQLSRTAGYLLLLRDPALAGVTMMYALCIARWLPYASYRITGVNWVKENYQMHFCTAYLTLGLLFGFYLGGFEWAQFGIGVLYLVARSRRSIRALLGAKRSAEL